MIRAVIFDMDGVLINTEKYLYQYWRQAAEEEGFVLTREVALSLRSLSGKFAAPMLQEIYGPEFSYEKIRNRRKELMEAHLNQNGIEKKPGVEEALKELRSQGFKLAVATATEEIRAVDYLERIGIKKYFHKIICATMVKNGKPMPDIYQYACSMIGEDPKHCVAVEDSPNGVQSAWAAGLRVIMIPDLTQPDEEIKKKIWKKADNLRELTHLLID